MVKFKKGITKKNNIEINSQVINKVKDIFKLNNWSIENEVDSTGFNWRIRFNMYCQMLDRLNEEQKELILELTKDYKYISSSRYISMLNKLINRLYKENWKEINQFANVYVMPLISPDEKQLSNVKSSTMLAYLFMSTDIMYNNNLGNTRFIRVETIEGIPKKINTKKNSIIFLVDDFIGTGETALKALEYIEKNGIKKDKIIVLALVGQKEGINKLQQNNVNVYVLEFYEKGITDKYKGTKLQKYINIMKEIEQSLNINQKYNFGYGGSEALITMARTPNNTFPIFWYEGKKKNVVAPFPRR